jgi:ankyrin repeat protein
LAIVEKLVAAGAHVNTPDWTPLIYAAFNGHAPVVQFLLKARADVNAASDNGTTALMAASRGGFTEVVDLLLRAGADPNRTNENGETAVDVALHFKQTDVAAKVRKAGGRSGKSVKLEIK